MSDVITIIVEIIFGLISVFEFSFVARQLCLCLGFVNMKRISVTIIVVFRVSVCLLWKKALFFVEFVVD